MVLTKDGMGTLNELIASFLNDDGSYNWDEIEKVMKKPAATEAEVVALTITYLSMDDPEDINRFFFFGFDTEQTPVRVDHGDGTYEYVYTGMTPSETFKKIAATAEQLAITVAVIYTANGMELSEEAKRMLRNAEMAQYAAVYGAGDDWRIGGDTYGNYQNIQDCPCYAGIDDEGNFVFYDNHEPVELSLVPIHPNSKTLEERVREYEDRYHAYESNPAVSFATSVALGIVMALAIPEMVLGVIIGATFDLMGTLADAYSGADVDTMVADVRILMILDLLGATAYIVKGPHGYMFFGVNYNTTQNAIRTYGFISTVGKGYNLTKKQLEDIIRGGPYDDPKSENYKIFEAYRGYVNKNGQSAPFRDGLYDILNPDGTPESEKRPIESLTPEEIRQLTIEYNAREAAKK